jgi:hypothetical protein
MPEIDNSAVAAIFEAAVKSPLGIVAFSLLLVVFVAVVFCRSAGIWFRVAVFAIVVAFAGVSAAAILNAVPVPARFAGPGAIDVSAASRPPAGSAPQSLSSAPQGDMTSATRPPVPSASVRPPGSTSPADSATPQARVEPQGIDNEEASRFADRFLTAIDGGSVSSAWSDTAQFFRESVSQAAFNA